MSDDSSKLVEGVIQPEEILTTLHQKRNDLINGDTPVYLQLNPLGQYLCQKDVLNV